VTSLRSDVTFSCALPYMVISLPHMALLACGYIFRTKRNVSDMFNIIATNFEFSLHDRYGNSVCCGDKLSRAFCTLVLCLWKWKQINIKDLESFHLRPSSAAKCWSARITTIGRSQFTIMSTRRCSPVAVLVDTIRYYMTQVQPLSRCGPTEIPSSGGGRPMHGPRRTGFNLS